MNYDKIPEINPLRHIRDYYDFIANFRSEWEKLVLAIKLIKSELKLLQDKKKDT